MIRALIIVAAVCCAGAFYRLCASVELMLQNREDTRRPGQAR